MTEERKLDQDKQQDSHINPNLEDKSFPLEVLASHDEAINKLKSFLTTVGSTVTIDSHNGSYFTVKK